jgi:hypothetical protein
MTNLKLPTLTWHTLDRIAGGRSTATIGYKTTVTANADGMFGTFAIRHHGNVIAYVGLTRVQLVHAGWDSITTAHRLNRVCVDNGLDVRVGIRQGILSLMRGSEIWSLPREQRATFDVKA